MMKNQNKSSRILLKPCEWDKYGHFVHCMQYWYWVTSTVLNNSECEYICSTPKIPWKRPYVEAYLDRVLLELPNLKIVTEHSDEGLEFCHRDSIKDYFLHNDAKLKHVYRKWFPYDNSDSVRRIFVPIKCRIVCDTSSSSVSEIVQFALCDIFRSNILLEI